MKTLVFMLVSTTVVLWAAVPTIRNLTPPNDPGALTAEQYREYSPTARERIVAMLVFEQDRSGAPLPNECRWTARAILDQAVQQYPPDETVSAILERECS